MLAQTVGPDLKTFALETFLRRLGEGPLSTAADSCVAAELGIEVSNRIMASAMHKAIVSGWVVRCRDRDVRDHYDNPVTYKLTARGHEQLGRLNTQ